MLDKRPKNTEPAPARRVLHFFGLDSSRDKADPTSKQRPPNEPEERNRASLEACRLTNSFWIRGNSCGSFTEIAEISGTPLIYWTKLPGNRVPLSYVITLQHLIAACSHSESRL